MLLRLPFIVLLLTLIISITMASSSGTKEAAFAAVPGDNNNGSGQNEVPLLPEADPNNPKNIPSIKLGETISFEAMGPIIINSDGTYLHMWI